MNNPTFHFNDSLREVPDSTDDWNSYIQYLIDNLTISSDENTRINLLGQLGTHLRVVGRLDESVTYLKEAIDLCSDKSLLVNRFLNYVRLAHTYQWMKNYELAHENFDLAKDIISSHKINEGLIAFYHQHLGKLFFDQNFYLKSSIEFAKALEIRKRIGANTELIDSSEISLNTSKQILSQSLDIEIRDVAINDLSDIARIEYSWCGESGATYDDFQSFYKNMTDKEAIKVLKFENRVIGFIGIQFISLNTINIWNLGVDEAFRRYSVGSSLIREIINFSKIKDVQNILLDVAKENLKAVECYKKMGFVVTEEIQDYYGIGQNGLRLIFNISN